ncbi:MAG: hypothetical protein N2260_08340 [Syntrophobacterales bacterium]|nr:hypothetical protein [Syntrophobacterales bacterium]
MNLKTLWKIYPHILVLHFFALLFFGISTWFLVGKIKSYNEARILERSLRSNEEKLISLKKLVEDIDRYQTFLSQLTYPKEVMIEEYIMPEPLNEMLKKISTIYNGKGFFFLESMNISTCLEIKDMKISEKTNCIPMVNIKGKKVYLTHETP